MPPLSTTNIAVIDPAHEVETYRDEIKRVSPPWLSIGVAEKYLYAWALHIDALGDAVIAAVMHRFPGMFSFESLGLLGRERRIPRGRLEDDATFAGRLIRWLTDHRVRGGPYALLGQTAAHYAPALFPIDLIYTSGRRFHITAEGIDAIAAGTPIDDVIIRVDQDIHADVLTDGWARWWMVYNTDQWVDVPPNDAELADIRLVPQSWNAAHCIGTIILLPTAAELWNWPIGHTWSETGTWNVDGPEPRLIPVDGGGSVVARGGGAVAAGAGETI